MKPVGNHRLCSRHCFGIKDFSDLGDGRVFGMGRAVLHRVGREEYLVCTITRSPTQIRPAHSRPPGGLQASVWALQTYLTASGDEIDSDPLTVDARISGPLWSDIWRSRGAPKYFSDWGERTARIRLLWRGPFLNATRNYNCIFASAMQKRDLESLGEEIRNGDRL